MATLFDNDDDDVDYGRNTYEAPPSSPAPQMSSEDVDSDTLTAPRKGKQPAQRRNPLGDISIQNKPSGGLSKSRRQVANDLEVCYTSILFLTDPTLTDVLETLMEGIEAAELGYQAIQSP